MASRPSPGREARVCKNRYALSLDVSGILFEATAEWVYHKTVTAIRAIFDGKTFVPKQPIDLPPQSEALIIIEGSDAAAQDQLDQAIRAYYESGPDADDDAWASATSPGSHRAWDED